jgi:4-hydroxybenzoyl-CoA reductase subunit beta
MTPFEFHSPETLPEALELLKSSPNSRTIAGGTDLLVLMKDLLVSPSVLISLSRVKELTGSTVGEKGCELGPMTPLWRLERNKEVEKRYPALVQALRSLAVPPIRNQATVGGNLCLDTKCIYYNQSQGWKRNLTPCIKAGGQVCHVAPAGKRCVGALVAETAGPFWIYGAELTLRSSLHSRLVPIEMFFTGDGLRPHDFTPDEVLTAIHLPPTPSRMGTAYSRFAYRKALEFSQVNLTASLTLGERNRIEKARLVVGAIGPAPVEVKESLSCLAGENPSEKMWAEAARGVAREAIRLSRSPRLTPYLQEVVTAYAERLFQQAWQKAIGNTA